MIVSYSFVIAPKVQRRCCYCSQIIYSCAIRKFGVEVENEDLPRKEQTRTPWVLWQCEDCTIAEGNRCEKWQREKIENCFLKLGEAKERIEEIYERRLLASAKAQENEWRQAQKESMQARGLDVTEFVQAQLSASSEYISEASRLAKSLGYHSAHWDSESNRSRREKAEEAALQKSVSLARQEAILKAMKEEKK